MLLVLHLATVALFVLLGIVFLCGKGAFLIAGHNTLPPEEKAKVDEKKLTRFMGKFMFALAACWSLLVCSEIFRAIFLLWLGIALTLITTIAGCIYANTGNRFRQQ